LLRCEQTGKQTNILITILNTLNWETKQSENDIGTIIISLIITVGLVLVYQFITGVVDN